jgi:hypothetical protein
MGWAISNQRFHSFPCLGNMLIIQLLKIHYTPSVPGKVSHRHFCRKGLYISPTKPIVLIVFSASSLSSTAAPPLSRTPARRPPWLSRALLLPHASSRSIPLPPPEFPRPEFPRPLLPVLSPTPPSTPLPKCPLFSPAIRMSQRTPEVQQQKIGSSPKDSIRSSGARSGGHGDEGGDEVVLRCCVRRGGQRFHLFPPCPEAARQ